MELCDDQATTNIDVTANITDISGIKIIIKTTNLATITLVKHIVENSTVYKVVDESDICGLRVKILLLAWFEP